MSLPRRFPTYRKLLRLFPAAYRRDYEDQMLQTLADMLDDPNRSRLSVWARTAADFPISLAREQAASVNTAIAQSPAYIRHSGMLGGVMVAPFFIIVAANALSHQALYYSVLWHTWVLFTWIIILPGLAVLLNAIALYRWMRQIAGGHSSRRLRNLLMSRQGWPALSIMLIGLGILVLVFGHDSVSCIGGNPFQEISDWRGTLQCLRDR